MSKEEKAKEYAGISKIMIFDTKWQERVKVKYNAYLAGYTAAEQDPSSQLGAYKEALSIAYDLIASSTEYEVGIVRYKEGLLKINELLKPKP